MAGQSAPSPPDQGEALSQGSRHNKARLNQCGNIHNLLDSQLNLPQPKIMIAGVYSAMLGKSDANETGD